MDVDRLRRLWIGRDEGGLSRGRVEAWRFGLL